MGERMFDISGCRAGVLRRAWCRFCYWLYVKSGIPVQWLPIGEMLADAGCVTYAADRAKCGFAGCRVCAPSQSQGER